MSDEPIHFLNDRARSMNSREPVAEIVEALEDALKLAQAGMLRNYAIAYEDISANQEDPFLVTHLIAHNFTHHIKLSGLLMKLQHEIGETLNQE